MCSNLFLVKLGKLRVAGSSPVYRTNILGCGVTVNTVDSNSMDVGSTPTILAKPMKLLLTLL